MLRLANWRACMPRYHCPGCEAGVLAKVEDTRHGAAEWFGKMPDHCPWMEKAQLRCTRVCLESCGASVYAAPGAAVAFVAIFMCSTTKTRLAITPMFTAQEYSYRLSQSVARGVGWWACWCRLAYAMLAAACQSPCQPTRCEYCRVSIAGN